MEALASGRNIRISAAMTAPRCTTRLAANSSEPRSAVATASASDPPPASLKGDLALRLLETYPDVAVVDIDLPGLDGLTAAEQLHQRLPACRTLVLTGLSQPGNLLRALKVHVRGFIVKDAPAATLADGVRRAAVAVTRHRPQLPVQCHQQARRPQPHRRDPHRPRRRLAVSGRPRLVSCCRAGAEDSGSRI